MSVKLLRTDFSTMVVQHIKSIQNGMPEACQGRGQAMELKKRLWRHLYDLQVLIHTSIRPHYVINLSFLCYLYSF